MIHERCDDSSTRTNEHRHCMMPTHVMATALAVPEFGVTEVWRETTTTRRPRPFCDGRTAATGAHPRSRTGWRHAQRVARTVRQANALNRAVATPADARHAGHADVTCQHQRELRPFTGKHCALWAGDEPRIGQAGDWRRMLPKRVLLRPCGMSRTVLLALEGEGSPKIKLHSRKAVWQLVAHAVFDSLVIDA